MIAPSCRAELSPLFGPAHKAGFFIGLCYLSNELTIAVAASAADAWSVMLRLAPHPARHSWSCKCGNASQCCGPSFSLTFEAPVVI